MTIDSNEQAKNTSDRDDRLRDLPTTLESTGFAADEMVSCSKCGRSNPPNRPKCFYCGETMIVAPKYSDFVRPNLRQLESWEKGFNVILLQPKNVTSANKTFIANELRLEHEAIPKIFAGAGPMPVARVESSQEAEQVCLRFRKSGIECSVVPDILLDLDQPPRRLRGIELTERGLTAVDFNTDEMLSVGMGDLLLIVAGTLFEMRTRSFEKRKKGESEIVDQSDTSADESVIDLYSRGDQRGLRIYESGFDFSCLGADKSLLAANNMPKLLQKLRKAFPASKFIEEYTILQRGLEITWPLESHKDFEGLRRSGFGKADFGNTVTVSNLTQFNRYSRLHRHLV